MSDHDYLDSSSAKTTTAQRASETTESSSAESMPYVQRDPAEQVTCRAGDASCAGAHASTLSRATHLDRTPASRSVLRLQRQYGNRFARQVLTLAREADAGAAPSAHVERSIESARGGGQALDSGVRARMEPSYRADFSEVRIHTDARADSLNRSLSAKAFTTGTDIFFREGAYNPGSSSGRELLAHELTHVVQQGGSGPIQRKMTVSQPGDPHEVEADQMAHAVMQQENSPAAHSHETTSVARATHEEEKKLHEGALQRQPEAPKHEEDERKKKLHAKLDGDMVSRQEAEEKE